MFDFNCDCAQEYGVYKNEKELEIAKYVSSINIAAGFHSGDPLSIKRALEFAKENNVSIGAHIGYQDIQGFGSRKVELNDEELETTVIYQISAISSFANAMGLEIEHARLHGAMKNELNSNIDFAKKVACAIKKLNPWLNLYINNSEFKEILEKETGIKCAFEVNFQDWGTIRQIRELEVKPDTIHFCNVEDAMRAREVLKPTPVNFNRVGGQI